jgi:pyruvate-formate lyase-activating enzyme
MRNIVRKFNILRDRLKLLRDVRRNNGTISTRYQTVMIETTSFCNLDCPICPARKSQNVMERASKQVKVDDVRLIVNLTKHMTETFCLNMWGEPLLHKEFGEILRIVSDAGLPIWFSTNLNYSARLAEMLAPNPLLHIICSLDGWDSESYAEYRWGGRFDVVKRNLEILSKGQCRIYPQYLIGAEHKDAEARKARFLTFVEATVGNTKNVFFKKKIDDLRNDGNDTVPGRCGSMYAGLYFNSDGILMPCCTNARKDVYLRHVSAYSSQDLYNGDEVNTLRSRILDNKNQFPSCRTCQGENQEKLIANVIIQGLKKLFVTGKIQPGSSKSL